MEKFHNFHDYSPLPRDFLDFFEFGKYLKFEDPLIHLIWEKFQIGEKKITFK